MTPSKEVPVTPGDMATAKKIVDPGNTKWWGPGKNTTMENVTRDIAEALRSERERVLEEVKPLEIALSDWVRSYAPEMCDPLDVKETAKRISRKGTLAYIADVSSRWFTFKKELLGGE